MFSKQAIQNPISVIAAVVLALVIFASADISEAKLLRRSRLYDEPYGSGGYGGYSGYNGYNGYSGYNNGFGGPYGAYDRGIPMATGQRALLTIRGTRNPYDGSAPGKLAIDDQPFRGPYPRGIYDRLQSPADMGYGPMFGAPRRIAVTGAYPLGYGRFA